MRKGCLGSLLILTLPAVMTMPAAAQGIGIDLGGLGSVNIGGSGSGGNGGINVSVGGVNVSVGGGSPPAGGGADGGTGSPGSGGSTGGTGSPGGAAPPGSSGSGGAGSATSPTVTELTQGATVDAVGARRALPLDVILTKAKAIIGDGQVVDAKLLAYRNILYYDLKVLVANGDVTELYFYARSGERIQTR